MIPRIVAARLLRSDMWLVSFYPDDEYQFAMSRLVPAIEDPTTCPGGAWCEQFGCKERLEEFIAEQETVVLEDEETIVPTCTNCELNIFECECEYSPENWADLEGVDCSAGCDGEGHIGCELS